MADDRDRYCSGGFLIASCAFVNDLRHWPMKGRAKWSNELKACVKTNDDDGRLNVTVTAATDIAQLIIMLIGLLRTRRERHGLLGHLYVQVSGVV